MPYAYLVTVSNGHLVMRIFTADGSSAYIHALTIVPRAALPSFQFGQSGTTPASGLDMISNFNSDSAGLGYGFTYKSNDTNADSGSVYGSDLVFRVDLPAGSYLVTPTLGYQGNTADGALVYLQGSLAGMLPTGNGNQTKSYVAVVSSSGYLSLETVATTSSYDKFVHIDSLTILPLQFQFSPVPPPSSTSGRTAAYTNTGYTSTFGYGFLPAPNNNMNQDVGAVYATDLTFQVALPDGTYEVTPTLASTGNASDYDTVKLQNIAEPSVATGSGVLTASYLAVVTNGYLTLEFAGGVSGHNAAISALSIAMVSGGAQNLSGSFNRPGVVADGSTFSGGLDGGGYSYSGNLLGKTVTAGGNTFTLGATGGNDTISANGQVITLTEGNYTTLAFLGTGVDGNQGNQTFTVTYTDGTSQPFTQGLSDWFNADGGTGPIRLHLRVE